MEILAKLFGDEDRLKILRLFLFNPEAVYDKREVSRRSDVRADKASKIVKLFISLGVVRKRRLPKKEIGYCFDQRFPHAAVIFDLIAAASIRADERLAKRIAPAGKIKLAIAAGIFTRQMDAQLDLLIVGDDIREAKLSRIIRSIESDVGREIAYSTLTATEFDYRSAMHDRLVMDVLDFPHIVITDRIGFSRKNSGK